MKKPEEKRALLGDLRIGKEVDHENYRFYFGNEDCHYPGTLISGCKMLEKCIDFATSYYARREGGISNLFVHVDGDILRQVHVSDVMECIVWPVKEMDPVHIFPINRDKENAVISRLFSMFSINLVQAKSSKNKGF